MYPFYGRFKTLKTYGHWTAIQELLFRVALKQLNSDAADKSGCKLEWLIVLHHLSHHSSAFLLHGQGTCLVRCTLCSPPISQQNTIPNILVPKTALSNEGRLAWIPLSWCAI